MSKNEHIANTHILSNGSDIEFCIMPFSPNFKCLTNYR